MNNDLISREALKKVITANHYLLSSRNNSIDYGMFTTGIMQAIDNAPTVEEKPFEINVFLENADESTLLDIKKQLSRILTERAEREAYKEARREAMRLDDNEDSLVWRFRH